MGMTILAMFEGVKAKNFRSGRYAASQDIAFFSSFRYVCGMFLYSKRLFQASVLALAVGLLAGCASVGSMPSLVIGNATEQKIEGVVVVSGGDTLDFGTVAPLAVSFPHARLAPLEGTVTIRWVSGGTQKSRKVKLGDELRNYGGHMQFEVNVNDVVKVFTAPVEKSGDSVLPWSMPANWEGSPSIPGMN